MFGLLAEYMNPRAGLTHAVCIDLLTVLLTWPMGRGFGGVGSRFRCCRSAASTFLSSVKCTGSCLQLSEMGEIW